MPVSSSPVEPRNARSRRTRAGLLKAAREIANTDGFEALTMSAVGERAGVTRRSVYLHFASRSALVGALFAYNAEVEGLHESLAQVWAAVDAERVLDAWAAHLFRYHPRVIADDRAVRRLAHHDDDAAAFRRRVIDAQTDSCTRIVARIVDDGRLREPWTPETAAGMLRALISSDAVETLLDELGWSPRRAADHYGLLLKRTLLTCSP